MNKKRFDVWIRVTISLAVCLIGLTLRVHQVEAINEPPDTHLLQPIEYVTSDFSVEPAGHNLWTSTTESSTLTSLVKQKSLESHILPDACEQPGIPQLISPDNYSTTSNKWPYFDWGDVNYATEYRIAIQDVNDAYNYLFESTTASEYTPSADLKDGDYQWQVLGVNAADGCFVTGELSTIWAFKLDSTPEPTCETPGIPQLISPANKSITDDKRPKFDWGEVAYATEYRIAIQDANDPYNYLFETTTASEFTPSADLEDGDYQWQVLGVNTANACFVTGELSATWSFTLDTTPACEQPGKPLLIAPPNNSTIQDTRPRFDWGDVAQATEYQIAIQDDHDPYDYILETTTASEYVPTSDLADSDYQWVVFASNKSASCNVNGEISDTWAFTVDTTPTPTCETPAKPQLITPTNNSLIQNKRPRFDWVNVTYATEYRIAIQDANDPYNYLFETTTASEFTPSADLKDGEYQWQVLAVNTANGCFVTGELSAVWSVTLDTTPPVTPNLISPPNEAVLDTNTPTFEWSISPNAWLYELQVDNLSNFSSPEVNVYIESSSYTVSTLADSTYFWRVRARDEVGNWSGWSVIRRFTIASSVTPPQPPSLLSPPNGASITDATPLFDWSTTTGATGYQILVDNNSSFTSPEIDVSPTTSTFTPSSNLADGTYWWKVRVQVEAGNWSNWSTTWSFTLTTSSPLIVDSGFRPNPDGYSFSNYGGVYYDDFTIDDMSRMFGDDVVCIMNGSVCQPRPEAVEYQILANEWMAGGRCTGFTVSSLRFFKGYDDPKDIQAGVNTPYDILKENGRRHVSYYWVHQTVEPVASAGSHTWQYPPSQILAELQTALSNGTPDPVDLIIYAGDKHAGHSIAPFAIEDKGSGIYWIRVYDNNYPNDFTNYVIINTENETWSYPTMSWEGDAYTHTIGLKPISVYDQQAICWWCDTSGTHATTVSGQLWLYSADRILISDSQSRRIGFVGDELVNEIPDARGTVLVGGLGIAMEPIFSLPQNEIYSIQLLGAAMLKAQTLVTEEVLSEEVKVSQFGPGYVVTVDDLKVTATSEDLLHISSDGTKVTYLASSNVHPSVQMGMSGSGVGREFRIKGADIGAGQTITITANIASQQLVFDNSQTDGGSYDLSLFRSDTQGSNAFNHFDVPVAASDTQYINYGTWEDTDTVTLEVDSGSDGMIDETIVLENQTRTIFLPVISGH